MSDREFTRLKSQVYRPEDMGLKLIRTNQETSVRWLEKVSPTEPVTVPLLPPESRRSAQPVVKARLNGGSPVSLVIDTGAPVNLIHLTAALENQVRVADPQVLGNLFQGLGGYEQVYYGMIDLLVLGKLQFQSAFTAIRTRTYRRKFAGIMPVFRWEANSLGMSSLSRLSYLTIDYPCHTITFSTRQLFPDPKRSPTACLDFRLRSMQILVDLQVEGSERFAALLDTGNDANLMLPKALIAKLGYGESAGRGKKGKYLGLGGEIATRTFTIPRVHLGEATFTQVATVAAPDTFPATLGSGFLRSYKVTVDFRRMKLWLEP